MTLCITAKVNPDLDGVSCALAYADLLQQQGIAAEGCVFGAPQAEVDYFIKHHNISIKTYANNTPTLWDSYILVDASSMRGMPKVVQADLVQEIIDHREGTPEQDFLHATIQNELVGAAATLVVERFVKHNLLPRHNHALLLYGAIFHNTLNFITKNTTPRDTQAMRFLEQKFKLTPQIAYAIFDYATQEITHDIEHAIISDAKQFGTFNFYQLVVSNLDYARIEAPIAHIIHEQDMQHPCQWSILNLVNVAQKTSALYVSTQIGQDICATALGCTFNNSWAIIPAQLRKEIMPQIMIVIGLPFNSATLRSG